jgi:BirA family transcriptional regulator, biotin operon repressor / biotin---[acetyl-CoA-carboxylase] ligase
MSIIKLDAIDSTNNFLKELSRNQPLDNFTVVVANSQLNGRGQMGAIWESEDGKNLTMSVLIKNIDVVVDDIFALNAMISTAIIKGIEVFEIPKLSIKWPNDIMSEDKKIAGILIENALKTDNTISTVIGIGLNVNQKQFQNLPNASSLFIQTGREFSIDFLLNEIINSIKKYYQFILEKDYQSLWDIYHQNLFKKETIMLFEDSDNNRFTGKIKSVNRQGKLEIMIEDNSVKEYSIKEVKMIY